MGAKQFDYRFMTPPHGLHQRGLAIFILPVTVNTLMNDVANLKKVFVEGTITIESYLAESLLLSSRKHLLEKKQEHNYSPEVPYRSLCVLEDGNLVAV